MLADACPDPRLMERLTGRIRSRDGSAASWRSGGEALALAILTSRGLQSSLPLWASDLADTMVGSTLRVLDNSVDHASVKDRVALGLAAATLSVARPHCTRVLDGAVDAWIGWTPEGPEVEHGEDVLAAWTMLHLMRGNTDAAAECAHVLCDADNTGVGLILHDWVVARIQGHGSQRELQSFHALRAVLSTTGGFRPGLLIAAAATTTRVTGMKRRTTLEWLDRIALDLAADGTSRATPLAAPRL